MVLKHEEPAGIIGVAARFAGREIKPEGSNIGTQRTSKQRRQTLTVNVGDMFRLATRFGRERGLLGGYSRVGIAMQKLAANQQDDQIVRDNTLGIWVVA